MLNDLIEKLNINLDSLTKVDQEVYQTLLENIHEVRNATVTEFAATHHLSQASITRFCKKIGYNGFNDFKFALYHYQKQDLINSANHNRSVFQMYAQLIMKMEEFIDESYIETLAQQLAKANKIICLGANKSTLPAKLLQLSLMRISIMSTVLYYDEWNTLAGCVSENDWVIIFSANGKYKHLSEELLKINHSNKLLIYMNEKNILKNKVTHSILLPSSKNQNMDGYLENSIVFSVFVDYLVSHIAKYAK